MLSVTRKFRPILIAIFILLALLSLIAFIKPHSIHSVSSLIYPSEIFRNGKPTIHYNGLGTYSINSTCDPLSPQPCRENATFYMLVTNSESDITGAVQSVRELEDRFNRKYNYPWIFLNDEPFSDEFKSRLSVLVSGPVEFAQVPSADWNQPPWIDPDKVAQRIHEMEEEGVPRSNVISYHNMCRFNSGFFYRHPLLQKFKYAWRVEPEVHFYCDIKFDPFAYLRENNKIYGFNMAMYEWRPTIPSLWSVVKDFIQQHPDYVPQDNAMDFVSDDGGAEYNTCMFYNNFEITDMDFWRGEAYSAFFDHLDHQGGFYFERWGDAPVRSIGLALLAGKDRTHFFNEIGYKHYVHTHCPAGDDWRHGQCACNPSPEHSFAYSENSCLPRWEKLVGRQ